MKNEFGLSFSGKKTKDLIILTEDFKHRSIKFRYLYN